MKEYFYEVNIGENCNQGITKAPSAYEALKGTREFLTKEVGHDKWVFSKFYKVS